MRLEEMAPVASGRRRLRETSTPCNLLNALFIQLHYKTNESRPKIIWLLTSVFLLINEQTKQDHISE